MHQIIAGFFFFDFRDKTLLILGRVIIHVHLTWPKFPVAACVKLRPLGRLLPWKRIQNWSWNFLLELFFPGEGSHSACCEAWFQKSVGERPSVSEVCVPPALISSAVSWTPSRPRWRLRDDSSEKNSFVPLFVRDKRGGALAVAGLTAV